MGVWLLKEGARGLEDEGVGTEEGAEEKEEVDGADGVEGAFPRPRSKDDFFPVHPERVPPGG